MPWNDITRQQHNRDRLRNPTDLTDEEWAVIARLIPPAKPGGRPRTTDMREVMNGILYIAESGGQWRALPKDFPPVSTVRGYFYSWRDIGLWQTINQILVADVQDRDGAPDILKAIRYRFPWLRHVFADGGYAGEKLRDALAGNGEWTIEIIRRSDTAKGFEVLSRRWVVERTFGWLGRCRRLAKDWEKSIESATAWVNIASIRVITRRLATYCFPA